MNENHYRYLSPQNRLRIEKSVESIMGKMNNELDVALISAFPEADDGGTDPLTHMQLCERFEAFLWDWACTNVASLREPEYVTTRRDIRDLSGDDPSFFVPRGTRLRIDSYDDQGYIVEYANGLFPVMFEDVGEVTFWSDYNEEQPHE